MILNYLFSQYLFLKKEKNVISLIFRQLHYISIFIIYIYFFPFNKKPHILKKYP